MKKISGLLRATLAAMFLMFLVGCGASSPRPISVTLSPSGTKAIDQAQTVNVTAGVANDSKSGGVTWTVSGGGTLTNVTPTSATYVAPLNTATVITATVTATSVSDPTKSTSVQITVNPLPAISTTTLAAATAGTAYTATISATGGTSPFTWSLTAGTLPAGLSLSASTSNSVTITGTPTGQIVANITVKIADAAGNSATQALTLTVNAPPPLTITTASLSAGVIGTAYSQTLAATGGVPTYTWSVTSGSLPAGLSLNAATGVISGTPSGTFTSTSNFTITAKDSQTPTAATKSASLSISISAPPLSVTTSSLPGGTLGTAYSQTLQATGGVQPYSWAVTTGTLPAGLTLNSATGVISGTPTGSFTSATNFTVTVTDAQTPTAKTATANLSITMAASPLSVTTTSASLPAGVAGSVYAGASLQAAGGVQPYSWAVTTGSLPAGLVLNGATGAISGTPTTAGTTNFTVTVTDSETPTARTAVANLSMTINPPVSVTTSSLAAGVVGTAYNQTLAATGGISPYSWAVTVGSLPAGLSLNAATGAITGTPTGPLVGVISFTIKVTDSESPAKTATAALSITISAPALSVTTTSLPLGTINTAYTGGTLQATGGVQAYTWAITSGSLPTGLTLNAATGAITGTPSATGTSSFAVQVTDSETPTFQTAVANLSISINNSVPVAVTTTSPQLPTGVVSSTYPTTNLQASGGVMPYTWSISVGTLPAGLTLNTSTGAITGTPTASGTSNFTVKVADSTKPAAVTATASLSITVKAALAVTTTTLPGGSIGIAYPSQTLVATGGISPYTWAVTTGSLPSGLTLNAATGVISGTPGGTTTGPVNFTVTVTDAETPAGKTASQALSITITVATLSVTTTSASLPVGVVSSLYPSTTLQATGGISPYTWGVTTGSLPAGLTLNAATGAISGTPTASGTVSFTVTVTDAETPTAKTATANLSIVVKPALTVTTASLAAGVIGTSYNQTLAATGGITPYSWAVTVGSLPAGLSLNSATGVISGTPSGTFTGTTNFTVTATDSESPTKTANAALSISVSAPALSVTTTTLPGGSIGIAYPSQTLVATGGISPYTWAVTTGSLPSGLTLNAATGVISGTPGGTTTGPVNFTVTVTDAETPAGKTASQALSITITVATLSVTTTSASLPVGVVSSLYPSTTLQATGGISPYTWGVTTGSLPAGLTLNAATGAISGTPTASGTVSFTVTVTDAETPTAKTATANLSIVVKPALTVTTASLAAGVIGTSYNQTLAATGGITPYSWAVTVGSLPAGLSLNSATGVISGTPSGTFTGTTNFTVTATDSESPTKTANAALSISVSAPALSVTTTNLPTGVISNSYSTTLGASGGVSPYTWSITAGALPAWASLNASTGAITGTPTATGTTSFTVTVTDSETPTAKTASAAVSITINSSAPLVITTTGLPQGVVGTSYQNALLQATGGVQPYTWSISAGALPGWASLNASTGAITGTPTATGTTNFTVKVTDSSGPTQSTTAALSITINAGLTITTASVPNGSISVFYNANVNASGGLQPYSWSITSGSLPPGLNFNNNNTLNISGTPTATGTYNFTLQVTDNENTPVSVSNGYTIIISNQPVGYTVSGNVSYSGAKTGWTYLQLNGNGCNNCGGNNLGTSISQATLTSGGAFTIHGVQPGTYTLQGFMDNLSPAFGAQNASNPTGSVANITVTNAGVSGVAVTLNDPAAVNLGGLAPTWAPNKGSGTFSGGVLISFKRIQNNNGIEMPASYTLQWSTSSSFATVTGSKSFAASGGNDPWIVNGLTNGTTYYFRAQGVAGSSTSNFSGISNGYLVGPPTGGNAVSGTVTFTETATGPLYVGFYDQGTGNLYATVVGSQASPPHSPAAYSVSVPNGTNYFFVGILDQNNSGLISGPGQVSNTNNGNPPPVVISGPLTNENLTLPNGNSLATVTTQTSQQINGGVTTTFYGIGFNVTGVLKLPVAVELATGPARSPGAVIPDDIANNSFGGGGGNSGKFNYFTSLNGGAPQVGDQYTLNVTYSDGTTQVPPLTVTVGAVLNAFATNLSPQGSGVSLTPDFSWTDPANASNYTYQFSLCCDQNGTIWQIPGNNSNSNGFSSTITNINWNSDPTGSGSLPNISSLNGSTNYNWSLQAQDANGNSAQVQVNFQTVAAPLTLPPAGSVGSVTVGQNFSLALNASGGTGPYNFTVNGTAVPPDGVTQISLGDNVTASNDGSNMLSLNGNPTSTGTVTLNNVTVTDSLSNSAGPFTYTITVNPVTPLAIRTPAMPGGNNGWAYSASVQANGGVQPYANFSVISGSLPAGLTLSFTSGNSAIISGTPTAIGTSSFTIKVTDNIGSTATQAFSITVTNCTFPLNGSYAFLLSGSKSTTDYQATLGSFVANTSGNITSGELDLNDTNHGPQNINSGISGTYCVGAGRLALINIVTGQGTASFAASLDSSDTNGHMIRYDSTSGEVSSGVLLKQTTGVTLSQITGPYAFGLIGVDGSGGRSGVAGQFAANGTSSFAGTLDANDSGNLGTNLTFNSTNLTLAANGRGTFTDTVTGQGSNNYAFYAVNATQLLLLETDLVSTTGSLLSGQALKQSGTFSNSSFSGVSVLETEGLDTNNSPATPTVMAGLITADGTVNFSFNGDQNDGGTTNSQGTTGTFSVASNGRVLLAGGGSHNPILYLTANNQGFFFNTNGKVDFGMFEPQVGSSFTNASIAGNFYGGSQQPVNYNVGAEVDFANLVTGSPGTLTVTSDSNSSGCGGGGNACPNSSLFTGTYVVSSNGRVVITPGAGQGSGGAILYIINGTSGSGQAVVLTGDSNPALIDFHQ